MILVDAHPEKVREERTRLIEVLRDSISSCKQINKEVQSKLEALSSLKPQREKTNLLQEELRESNQTVALPSQKGLSKKFPFNQTINLPKNVNSIKNEKPISTATFWSDFQNKFQPKNFIQNALSHFNTIWAFRANILPRTSNETSKVKYGNSNTSLEETIAEERNPNGRLKTSKHLQNLNSDKNTEVLIDELLIQELSKIINNGSSSQAKLEKISHILKQFSLSKSFPKTFEYSNLKNASVLSKRKFQKNKDSSQLDIS